MNWQGKVVNGTVVGGIRWTMTVNPDGTQTPGYTSNPVKGCQHGCRWIMPDGQVAICYAENVANRVAGAAYPEGFEHHYWNPRELDRWRTMPAGRKVFIDSMSDLFGAWVPKEQIQQVLDAAAARPDVIFQSLTKNAPRLLDFDLPSNLWVGVSTPPDYMFGKRLRPQSQRQMLLKSLKVLEEVGKRRDGVEWLSAEPLSWDIVPELRQHPDALDWIVIGAASNGAQLHAPDEANVRALVEFCDPRWIPVFYKSNLSTSAFARANWREEFPYG